MADSRTPGPGPAVPCATQVLRRPGEIRSAASGCLTGQCGKLTTSVSRVDAIPVDNPADERNCAAAQPADTLLAHGNASRAGAAGKKYLRVLSIAVLAAYTIEGAAAAVVADGLAFAGSACSGNPCLAGEGSGLRRLASSRTGWPFIPDTPAPAARRTASSAGRNRIQVPARGALCRAVAGPMNPCR